MDNRPIVDQQSPIIATGTGCPIPGRTMARKKLSPQDEPVPPAPATRRLLVYALDPAADTALATAGIARCVLPIRWESLDPGPIGEYIEVVDVDPSSGCAYVLFRHRI